MKVTLVYKAKAVCAKPGCPASVDRGYCDKHKPPPRPGRKMPKDWKRTRQRILKRDKHECKLKLEGCKGKATTVDHLTPPSKGGSEDDNNLVASCWPCQIKKGDRVLPKGTDGADHHHPDLPVVPAPAPAQGLPRLAEPDQKRGPK